MSSYFRWIKSGKKDDYFGAKPRSRSLDSKSLEASGIRLIIQNVLAIYFFFIRYNFSNFFFLKIGDNGFNDNHHCNEYICSFIT